MNYRIKVEMFENKFDESGYAKEINRADIYEQVVTDIDLQAIIEAVNAKRNLSK